MKEGVLSSKTKDSAEPEILDTQENQSMEIFKYLHFFYRKSNSRAHSGRGNALIKHSWLVVMSEPQHQI